MLEIEYKFLVDIEKFLSYIDEIKNNSGSCFTVKDIHQGYLYNKDKTVVRVRTVGKNLAYITYKEPTENPIVRVELEEKIGFDLAEKMLKLCDKVISKTRYAFVLPDTNQYMEVDVFHDIDLVLCEVEIDTYLPNRQLIKLDWMLEDVSTNPAYFNCNLEVINTAATSKEAVCSVSGLKRSDFDDLGNSLIEKLRLKN